jgi:hypothetical protein
MNGAVVENYDWEYWAVVEFDRILTLTVVYPSVTQIGLNLLTCPVSDSGGTDQEENGTQGNRNLNMNRNVSNSDSAHNPGSGDGHMEENGNNGNNGGEGGANGGGGNGPDGGIEEDDEISLDEFKALVKSRKKMKNCMTYMHFAEMQEKVMHVFGYVL